MPFNVEMISCLILVVFMVPLVGSRSRNGTLLNYTAFFGLETIGEILFLYLALHLIEHFEWWLLPLGLRPLWKQREQYVWMF